MDDQLLKAMEERAKAAMHYECSMLDEEQGMWVPAPEGHQEESWFSCPLCEGEGEIEGIVYDHKELASTVIAYGIGRGLGVADEWVKFGPHDVLALIAEVRRLRAAMS